MIDAAARCAKCGAPIGKCYCWITLRCKKCKRTLTVERDATDPKNCAVVQVSCPKCNPDDRAIVDYFDAAGMQINLDGEPITPSR
jgi:hypothetical protein